MTTTTISARIIYLYQALDKITAKHCVCSQTKCQLAKAFALQHGIMLETITIGGAHLLPYMQDGKCSVAPYLRPICVLSHPNPNSNSNPNPNPNYSKNKNNNDDTWNMADTRFYNEYAHYIREEEENFNNGRK